MGTPGERVDLLFDARHIDQSGIGTYITVQIPALEDVFARHGRTLAVLADRDYAPDVGATTSVVYSDPTNAPMYSLHEQRAWDHALDAVRPRAFWTPHYPFPFTLLRPRHRDVLAFITVHDDNHLLPTEISGQSNLRRAYARAMLGLDARRARILFSPSQAAADALAAYVPSARFVVTPIPVGPQWLQPADPGRSPVQDKFLLYLGNVKRHKNLPLLLEAYAQVQHDIPHRLVIAGSGASVKMLDERVHELATTLGERVQMIGRLDFDALHALVAAADLLVMPSLNEGAGLPPLEAMASGTAVLSSRIPPLRETCGDGADYFDPYDPQELAALLRRYCLDDAARAGLQARGHTHVHRRQAEIPTHAAAEAICAELPRR
ncbi:glycosyl transferase family 1 [Mycolicibacterium duvalii]|uniref:Glycosyl transferase n=1 Tax=Mycolicibacterium duvalii TaxID=39688 RepID=A0A7I7K338_9MYCO|nr:glycosyltransferase family 1 protein [Mycolicibacterium duvalii]MCV7370638.1 glycosyltransferase family 4 protein [Mycolicibacterium duvalii]PEG36844.1 glycosyl transferase family 1 [Mycolicibacterium duvalii]BBX17978.1 glycosyl transferase [Mycolicibacterium duvalii]